MQPNKTSKKTIIIIIIVILVAVLAYLYMKGSPENTVSSIEGQDINGMGIDNPTSVNVGLNVLALLNQINSIKIDAQFFKSNAFTSLIDHTVIVREQDVGKPNPFIGTFGKKIDKK